MTRNKKIIYILSVLILLTLGGMFWLSSRTAVQSMRDSIPFDQMMASFLVEGFDQMDPAEQGQVALQFDEPVRHIAHVAEFLVLGLLLANACIILKKPIRYGILIGIGAGVLDEVHQLFVTGRGCQMSDMCYDAIGVLLGAVLVWGLCAGRRRE